VLLIQAFSTMNYYVSSDGSDVDVLYILTSMHI